MEQIIYKELILVVLLFCLYLNLEDWGEWTLSL